MICFKIILLEMKTNSKDLLALNDSTIICGKCNLRTNSECQDHALGPTPSWQQDMNHHLPWQ